MEHDCLRLHAFFMFKVSYIITTYSYRNQKILNNGLTFVHKIVIQHLNRYRVINVLKCVMTKKSLCVYKINIKQS